MRIRPGERTASEPMSDRYESFVGHLSCTQRERGTQIGHNDLKRLKRSQQVVHLAVVDPLSNEGLASDVSHKRQPDTEANVFVDLVPKRARINLPAGSKLARRFPQHVQSDIAINGPADVNAVSNKRRRKLPFKMEGSNVGQCADTNIV